MNRLTVFIGAQIKGPILASEDYFAYTLHGKTALGVPKSGYR